MDVAWVRTVLEYTPLELDRGISYSQTSRDMVESLTSDPFRMAGRNLNIAPILS